MNVNNLNQTKDELVVRLIDHPESFTESEISQILADEECRKLYDAALELKCMVRERQVTQEETDAAWLQLKRRHNLRRTWWRLAAAVAGVVALSGIAYATISSIGLTSGSANDQPVNVAQASPSAATGSGQQTAGQDAGTDSAGVAAQQAPDTVTFTNAPLSSIVEQVAASHGMKADVRNASAATVRIYYVWAVADNIEKVVGDLNTFEHVKITITDDKLIID